MFVITLTNSHISCVLSAFSLAVAVVDIFSTIYQSFIDPSVQFMTMIGLMLPSSGLVQNLH